VPWAYVAAAAENFVDGGLAEKNQYDSGKTRLPQPSAVHVDAVTRRAFLSFAMQTLASLKVL